VIRLIAGTGEQYGGGHRTRMQTLQSLLLERGISCELLLCESDSDIRRLTQDPAKLVVLDVRDFPAGEFYPPVIALDNRNSGRAEDHRSIYYDAIPHPDAEDALENCLIDPALTLFAGRLSAESVKRDSASLSGDILIYAGRQKLPHFVEQFASEHPRACVVRESELPRTEFLDRLAAADAVVSYFGMTILEAMYLRKVAAVFSINSEVHDRLSLFLEQKCGVSFVRSAADLQSALKTAPSRCVPGQHGYSRLIALIEKTAEAV
jgi:hypothetical protein